MAHTMTQQLKTNLKPWLVNESEFPHEGSIQDQLQFLLRYAVLAQSFYNTQPWEFAVEGSQINIFAKESRWLKTADPEQRELYLSIGCAMENLLIAAEHFRFGHQISRFPQPNNDNWVARLNMTTISQSSALRSPALFGAITRRHTYHHKFDAKSLQKQHMQTIRKFLTEEDVWLQVSEDDQIREKIAKYAEHANTILFSDEQFLEEINDWSSKGLFGKPWFQAESTHSSNTQSSGTQSSERTTAAVKNSKTGPASKQKNYDSATAIQLNQLERDIIKTAPAIAVLSSPFDNHMMHVITGQIFEKLCLEAALLGIRCLPLNQLIEVPESRASVSELFPTIKGRPLVVFALGYGEEEMEQEFTPRLSFEQVLH